MKHLTSNILSLASFLVFGLLVASVQLPVFDITDLTTFPVWNGMVYIYILFWPIIVLWWIVKAIWFFLVSIRLWIIAVIAVVVIAVAIIEKVPALKPVSRWLASKL